MTEHQPFWLLAELTYSCPLQCAYCSNPVDYTGIRKNELNTQQWLDVLAQARNMGAVQLGLSGGEPCVRKDLEQIVEGASELGYYSNLITSAVGLDEARVKSLKTAGLDHIQISFQGADKHSNDLLAGTTCFEQKLKAAKAVKAAGYPLVFNFVVHRFNIAQVPALLTLADELEADFVEVANCQYHGWAFANKEALLPSLEQLQTAEAQVNAFKDQLTRNMEVYFVVPDYFEETINPCVNGWGRTMMNVAPDGVVLPCHGAREIPNIELPNVKNKTLEEIWQHSQLFNQFRGTDWMPEPCASCDQRDRDLGGCRCQALMITGDAANTDPCCPKSEHHHLIQALILPERERDNSVLKRGPKTNLIDVSELL